MVRRLGIKKYNIFVEKVRICFLTKNELNFNLYSSFSGGDIMVIDRKTKGKPDLTLASIYIRMKLNGVQGLIRDEEMS